MAKSIVNAFEVSQSQCRKIKGVCERSRNIFYEHTASRGKKYPSKPSETKMMGCQFKARNRSTYIGRNRWSHREGELANFEEIQEFAPKHTHYKDPMCFILNSAFIDALKRLIVGLFWRFPKWLCTEVSKSQISVPSGLRQFHRWIRRIRSRRKPKCAQFLSLFSR